MHAIGAIEEITVLEYEVDPQEECQEVQQQEVLGEGNPDGEQLPSAQITSPQPLWKASPGIF